MKPGTKVKIVGLGSAWNIDETICVARNYFYGTTTIIVEHPKGWTQRQGLEKRIFNTPISLDPNKKYLPVKPENTIIL